MPTSSQSAIPCDVAECKEPAVFFVTWAANRKCIKFENLCDEHARIEIASYAPPLRHRPYPARVTPTAIECDVEFVVNTIKHPEQAIYLRDCTAPRLVPILTGLFEAEALSRKLKGEQPPRPMSHDAMALFIKTLGAFVDEVYVDRLENGIYHANVRLTQGAKFLTVDIRPSDAFILAIIFQCPIMFNRELLETVVI